MALTDTALRNAKPTDKAYKLYDEKGLYLTVNPNDGKWWRLKYRFNNKEKTLSVGTYPEISLASARANVMKPVRWWPRVETQAKPEKKQRHRQS